MTLKLNIGYYYPDLLNLYGDNGNVEILAYRAQKKGIDVSVTNITIGESISPAELSKINLVFMGGGPDSSQKDLYNDLTKNKVQFLKAYVEKGNVALFICGAYQLIGHYYKASDGSVLQGLGIFDLYTAHFGSNKPRCIGNTYAQITPIVANDPVFPQSDALQANIVGFENHGGRTYLGKHIQPFAQIVKGYGNNAEDKTEGAIYKSAIGTYFHGPILARNPHFADFLIYKALNLPYDLIQKLPALDDTFVISAHTASKNLKQ